MRDPARKKESHVGAREIGGIKTGIRKIIPHVIERHDDDNDAANYVDGFDADAFTRDSLGHGAPPRPEFNKANYLS